MMSIPDPVAQQGALTGWSLAPFSGSPVAIHSGATHKGRFGAVILVQTPPELQTEGGGLLAVAVS